MAINPEQIKKLRVDAGFTQKQMSEKFGYSSVRSWQKKESGERSLDHVEEQYLLLITNTHPHYKLVKK